jgi:hypothetical protein
MRSSFLSNSTSVLSITEEEEEEFSPIIMSPDVTSPLFIMHYLFHELYKVVFNACL